MRYCQACHRCFGDGVEFCLFDHTPTRGVESLPLVIDGKYRLEKLIAHGGMGSVYRATHWQLERPVALKILRAEFLADPTVTERFHREARAAARLKHPNIVAVYDFGLLPCGGAYLVMELIEGRSLREEMRTHAAKFGQMRPERAAAILVQVCAGIEAAHRQGIIHRDLKPDNVMIETADDGTERVLVLDFGIAKLKDREYVLQGLTDENTVVGTPNYISPEQCTGQPVDARSDVYSLGVMLYEMLTGRVPFASQNTSTVLLRHLQEPPAPPTRFRPGLSRELEQLVLIALAKNPNLRFQSAAQFAEHLTAEVRAPLNYQGDEEDDTRIRQPVVAHQEINAPSLEFTGFSPAIKPEPALPLEYDLKLTPTVQTEEDQIVERVPTFLIEQRPRKKMFASLFVMGLIMAGVGGYYLNPGWKARADAVKESVRASLDPAQPRTEPTAALSNEAAPNETEGLQRSGQVVMAETARPASERIDNRKLESAGKNASPVVPVKNETPSAAMTAGDRAQREVRAVYSDWATSLMRGDWNKHMSFYADRVDYFRDGLLRRAQVEARKRRIFGSFDSYSLRFTEPRQVNLKTTEGIQEVDLVFDRQWVLRRGRKRIEGKARGLITMRRDGRGWRIVSERQIKK